MIAGAFRLRAPPAAAAGPGAQAQRAQQAQQAQELRRDIAAKRAAARAAAAAAYELATQVCWRAASAGGRRPSPLARARARDRAHARSL
jgi:hypothetical protein